MSLDAVRNLNQDAPTRDEIDEIKRQGIRKYISPWVSIDASSSQSFQHGLGYVPMVVSVLSATDSQGAGEGDASSFSTLSSVTTIVVVNSGSARYFRVRAL